MEFIIQVPISFPRLLSFICFVILLVILSFSPPHARNSSPSVIMTWTAPRACRQRRGGSRPSGNPKGAQFPRTDTHTR